MSHTISLEDAATQLSGLVRALGPEDEIVLTEDDKPVARTVPSRPQRKRIPGTWKGILAIAKEDKQHLEDFKD